MINPIIEVSGLSKKYRIGTKLPYKSLRETIMNAIASPVRMFRKKSSSSTPDADTFWALKDVSCEIQQGEVLGIIGRNGAEVIKSSLFPFILKIRSAAIF